MSVATGTSVIHTSVMSSAFNKHQSCQIRKAGFKRGKKQKSRFAIDSEKLEKIQAAFHNIVQRDMI